MFRAVADQVYGDEDMHDEVRRLCLDYMEKNRDHFSQFITEDFDQYISRKREKGVCGNHIELQAISEIYSRAIEIYQYSADPINIFNPRVDISSSSKPNAPIRLSYHGSSHYNSVVDPYEATIGVGLGLPGHSPGSADRNLVREAILKSESQLIEDAMLKDKIRLSDFECTEQQISEQVKNFLNVSYFKVSEWSRAAQDDAEEKSLLAQVMALSQQEYLNSLIKKSTKRNDFDQAGSSKSS
ncbi:unnamed protein product [Dracunculus medinensis]|uniref:ubiquitinyl hydrolase 1 n=1 Tax=Dracunculus medinensis TaxID=318479 RepID=A0A0N4U406_DRAME|nr:unnamed protein product [Dracunculus medinensis]